MVLSIIENWYLQSFRKSRLKNFGFDLMIIFKIPRILLYCPFKILLVNIVCWCEITWNGFQLCWFIAYHRCISKWIISHLRLQVNFQRFYHLLWFPFVSPLFEVEINFTKTNNIYSLLFFGLKKLLPWHINWTYHRWSDSSLEVLRPSTQKENARF